MDVVQLIECPRDAMQGIQAFIPTELKIAYHQALLKVGFHTLDVGSFVSPKSIPQMADTEQVLSAIGEKKGNTKLLVIVANKRGAEAACANPYVDYVGFPFSVSEIFQQRNANQNLTQAFELTQELLNLCGQRQKKLVVYLSMAFGNPYGETWNIDITLRWAFKMQAIGVEVVSFADTVGAAQSSDISKIFGEAIKLSETVWGAHLHSNPNSWQEKVTAAWDAGCRRFDSALGGYGGCPFAKDELVGNIATENIIHFLRNQPLNLDLASLHQAKTISQTIFKLI